MDPTLDISMYDNVEEKTERSEIIFVQVGLSILSGFIFGFIWTGFLMKSIKGYRKDFVRLPAYLLSNFLPFVQIFYLLKMRKMIVDTAAEKGVTVKIPKLALILSGCVFPVLFINVPALAVLQHGMNKVFAHEDK